MGKPNIHPEDFRHDERSEKTSSGRLRDLHHHGEEILTAGGGVIDDALRGELKAPGTDCRCGVNLVCRPPRDVIAAIQVVQRTLRQIEPGQYYYPSSDLHLTLFEICHSRSLEEAADLAELIRTKLQDMFALLPAPRLISPRFGFDARACAVNFLPADETLGSLRRSIREQIAKLGVAINPRYEPQSAHLTIMRYIAPLQSEPHQWVDILGEVEIAEGLTWPLTSAWFTWGANWYGMHARINEDGPFSLLSTNQS